jgi:hypothetical protein
MFARRSGHAIAIHVASTGRTGITITFASFSFRAARVAVPFMSTTFGRASEAFTIETASTWRTGKSFSFEFAAARTSEALPLNSTTFAATFEALAFEPTALGRTGKSFTIVATPRRWTIETASLAATTFWTPGETAIFAIAAFEAWTHGWTWWPATLESCVSFGATWSATFESRTVRTSRSAGPPHVLADGFRHLHEFVFAQFAVAVFIELREHLGWVRRLWTAAAFRATRAGGATFALAFASLTATSSAAHIAHFFARFGAFFAI